MSWTFAAHSPADSPAGPRQAHAAAHSRRCHRRHICHSWWQQNGHQPPGAAQHVSTELLQWSSHLLHPQRPITSSSATSSGSASCRSGSSVDCSRWTACSSVDCSGWTACSTVDCSGCMLSWQHRMSCLNLPLVQLQASDQDLNFAGPSGEVHVSARASYTGPPRPQDPHDFHSNSLGAAKIQIGFPMLGPDFLSDAFCMRHMAREHSRANEIGRRTLQCFDLDE